MHLLPIHLLRFLKTHLLVLVIILTSQFCHSQNLPEEDLWKGLERFKLGAGKALFETKLIAVEGGIDTTGKEKKYTYTYLSGPDSPIIFAGIRFSYAALTFNDAGKLKTVELHALYWANDTAMTKRNAEKDSKQVLACLESHLGKGGKLIQKDNPGWRIAMEYKWQKDNRLLIFSQHIKKSKKSSQGGSHFSAWLNDSK